MRTVIALMLCLTIALPIVVTGCSPPGPAVAAPPAVTGYPVQPSPTPDDENPVQVPSPTQVVPDSKSAPPSPTPAKRGKGEETSSTRGIFLWIDGVSGGATDALHEGWIQVLCYDLRIGGPVAPYAIGNETPAFSQFTILKAVDQASPKLAQFVCQGTRLPEVVIEACQGEEGAVEPHMRYRLTDVLITRYTNQASPKLMGGETLPLEEVSFLGGAIDPIEEVSFSTPLPIEEVSFVYRAVEWTSFTVEGVQISTGWNLAENSAL